MNENLSSPLLKGIARKKLSGNYMLTGSAFLVMELISSLISMIASRLLNGLELWQQILYYVIQLLVIILMGVFFLGEATLYLKLMTGKGPLLSDMFYAFKEHHQDLGILLRLIDTIVTVLLSLPGAVLMVIGVRPFDPVYFSLGIILFLIGSIVSFVLLSYISLAFFLAADFGNYSTPQIIKFSIKISAPRIWKIIYIKLSFIPVMLLAVLSFGIGFIWAMPYYKATMAALYIEIMNIESKKYN